MTALDIKDFNQRREDVADLHQLLAFFYLMQPGGFSFSASDLLGTVNKQPLNLMGPNENALYPSLPGQLTNPKSFAMRLRKMISVRRENNLDKGALIGIPKTASPGLMLLIYQLPNHMLQLLAINLAEVAATHTLEIPAIRNTSAIDLMTGLAEPKPLDSTQLRLTLAPFSGKVVLFQTKYYD